MDRFEYKIEKLAMNKKEVAEAKLNDLGDQGWELINVNTGSMFVSYTFKRKKEQSSSIAK